MHNLPTSCVCCSSESNKNTSESKLVNNSETSFDQRNNIDIKEVKTDSNQKYFYQYPEFLQKYCICFYRKVGIVSDRRKSLDEEVVSTPNEQGTPIIPIISPPEPYVLNYLNIYFFYIEKLMHVKAHFEG